MNGGMKHPKKNLIATFNWYFGENMVDKNNKGIGGGEDPHQRGSSPPHLRSSDMVL
jgi:hypothetical protein